MGNRVSRRTVLIGVGVGAVALAGGGYLALRNLPAGTAGFEQPRVLESSNGSLKVKLSAGKVSKSVNGKNVTMIGYNGSVPGPTLKVKPGDVIEVSLTNNLSKPTNLHTHGLFVSPSGNSDNPFVHVMPGETFDYRFEIPTEQTEGTHWYHPHMHGEVASQVFGGMYGAVIVEDANTPSALDDRVLVISDSSFNDDGTLASPNMMQLMMGREGNFIFVNGQIQPRGEFTDGGRERWRIINACVARYLQLEVSGANTQLLGLDGRKLPTIGEAGSFILAPGNRADLLVNPNTDSVSLNYTTVAHPDSMGMGMMNGTSQTFENYPLFTLNKKPDNGKVQIIDYVLPTFPAEPDLRKSAVTGKRDMVLKMPMGMGGMSGGMAGQFTINGEAFDMNKINTSVANNTVEEWSLVNKTTMQHPFHLHIWPMQIIDVGGVPVTDVRYQDVVTIPVNSTVTVRVNFRVHTGKTLYHCHILDHEDLGMMGVIESA